MKEKCDFLAIPHPRIVAQGDARPREARHRHPLSGPGWRGGRGAKPSGRTRGRTCSGSGSCGLLSGVLLPPATPRTGEPAEESAWPGAGAVGNPSSVSDRLFSWSISLRGERGAPLARSTGVTSSPRVRPPQPRPRPPEGSGPPGPARGPSSGGGTRRGWDVTPLGPGGKPLCPGEPGRARLSSRGSRPRVAALRLEARAAHLRCSRKTPPQPRPFLTSPLRPPRLFATMRGRYPSGRAARPGPVSLPCPVPSGLRGLQGLGAAANRCGGAGRRKQAECWAPR